MANKKTALGLGGFVARAFGLKSVCEWFFAWRSHPYRITVVEPGRIELPCRNSQFVASTRLVDHLISALGRGKTPYF